MKTAYSIIVAVLCIAGSSANVCRAQEVTNNWQGSDGGDWFDDASWSEGYAPTSGQHVAITLYSGTVNLSGSTPVLGDVVIANWKLTFSGWSTTLRCRNISIANGASLTMPSAFTDTSSNRINIACSNFALEVGAQIKADFLGYFGSKGRGGGGGLGYGGNYMSGVGAGGANVGSSKWWFYGGGGGYGGSGGFGDYIYGSGIQWYGESFGTAENAADSAGAGGGGSSAAGYGGEGGGAVRIDATGVVKINGQITANGNAAYNGAFGNNGGGGSGGGVYIACSCFDSNSVGSIRANGGNGGTGDAGPAFHGGGGGGGRIALKYDPLAQALAGPPKFTISAKPGGNSFPEASRKPGYGTIYLTDQQLLKTAILTDSTGLVYGVTNWTLASLSLTNRAWTFCEPVFTMSVAGNMVLGTNAYLGLPLRNSRLDCGGDLVLTNGGRLGIFSGVTNEFTTNYGALVSVTGTVWIGSNSWVYPQSDPTNGGSPLFAMQGLILNAGTNGGFDASGRGFVGGQGPGMGATNDIYGAGGGYGGAGGAATNGSLGGNPYGSLLAPLDPGSGSGQPIIGGAGGGLIYIKASGSVVADGVLRANGVMGAAPANGGGSGGGIFVITSNLTGSVGSILEARGGNSDSYGGAGGGGRIVFRIGVPDDIPGFAGISPPGTYHGTVSVAGGAGGYGAAEAGTKIFLVIPKKGMVFSVRSSY